VCRYDVRGSWPFGTEQSVCGLTTPGVDAVLGSQSKRIHSTIGSVTLLDCVKEWREDVWQIHSYNCSALSAMVGCTYTTSARRICKLKCRRDGKQTAPELSTGGAAFTALFKAMQESREQAATSLTTDFFFFPFARVI